MQQLVQCTMLNLQGQAHSDFPHQALEGSFVILGIVFQARECPTRLWNVNLACKAHQYTPVVPDLFRPDSISLHALGLDLHIVFCGIGDSPGCKRTKRTMMTILHPLLGIACHTSQHRQRILHIQDLMESKWISMSSNEMMDIKIFRYNSFNSDPTYHYCPSVLEMSMYAYVASLHCRILCYTLTSLPTSPNFLARIQ